MTPAQHDAIDAKVAELMGLKDVRRSATDDKHCSNTLRASFSVRCSPATTKRTTTRIRKKTATQSSTATASRTPPRPSPWPSAAAFSAPTVSTPTPSRSPPSDPAHHRRHRACRVVLREHRHRDWYGPQGH